MKRKLEKIKNFEVKFSYVKKKKQQNKVEYKVIKKQHCGMIVD